MHRRQLVDLLSAPHAAVVAVQDGRIVKLGVSRKLGKYVILRDVYGDVFTYAGLGSIAPSYSRSKSPHAPVKGPLAEAASTQAKPSPSQPASAGSHPPVTLQVKAPTGQGAPSPQATHQEATQPLQSESVPAGMGRVRLFAHPGNPDALAAASVARRSRAATQSPAGGRLPLRRGSVVAEGTVLGHVQRTGRSQGRSSALCDPPGWGPQHDRPSYDPRQLGQARGGAAPARARRARRTCSGRPRARCLLMSKSRLEREVLTDPGIVMSGCSRHEVASGAIDMRVLAVLAFLSRSGLKPTVATLRCGNGAYDVKGYVPADHTGDAVAISQINGIPVSGHQGAGSITDTTIRTLLTLPRQFVPRQIVSLMRVPGRRAHARAARPRRLHRGRLLPGAAKRAPAAKSPAAGAKAAHSAGPAPTAPAPAAVERRTDRGAVGPADRPHCGAAGAEGVHQAELLGDPGSEDALATEAGVGDTAECPRRCAACAGQNERVCRGRRACLPGPAHAFRAAGR